jgi:hypothetical protein
MTPPIRRGDGTTLAPQGIAEVRRGDGAVYFEGNPIPDSATFQWLYDDFASPWPDNIGNQNMSINGLTEDETAFGGSGAVSGDGSDDFGDSGTWGNWASNNLDNTFAIEVSLSISTTNRISVMGAVEGGSFSDIFFEIQVRGDLSGQPAIVRQDPNGTRQRVYFSTDVTDGGDYHIIWNFTGPEASDIDAYVNDSEITRDIDENGGQLTNDTDFPEAVYHFARNQSPSDTQHFGGVQRDITIYNDALTRSEVTSRFNNQPWT